MRQLIEMAREDDFSNIPAEEKDAMISVLEDAREERRTQHNHSSKAQALDVRGTTRSVDEEVCASR